MKIPCSRNVGGELPVAQTGHRQCSVEHQWIVKLLIDIAVQRALIDNKRSAAQFHIASHINGAVAQHHIAHIYPWPRETQTPRTGFGQHTIAANAPVDHQIGLGVNRATFGHVDEEVGQ